MYNKEIIYVKNAVENVSIIKGRSARYEVLCGI